MTPANDWMTDAAAEIAAGQSGEEFIGYFRAIIRKHCPFDEDVIYEPVNPMRDAAVENLHSSLMEFYKRHDIIHIPLPNVRSVFEAANEIVKTWK
jgi:hypothetical protein